MPGAAGTWQDLTDNVNLLAANLTTQVRAIADVATAVTKGDLTRSIQVEAQGEVAELKDNINADDRQPARDHANEHASKTGSRRTSRSSAACCRASATSTSSRSAPVRARAARRAQHGVVLRRWTTTTSTAALKLLASYADRRAQATPRGSRSAKAWSGSARSRSSASCSTNVPPRLLAASRRARRGEPRTVVVLPVLFEGAGEGGHRARDRFQRVHARIAPRVPRAAHRHRSASCSTRSRSRCAPRCCSSRRSSSRSSSRRSRRSCSRPTRSWPEGAAARRAERRGRAQEHARSSRRAARSRRRRPARAHLAVQVRVPREHVARAAHAAQQHAHPRPAARENVDSNLTAKQIEFAKTIHSRGHRPADADQRHPRSVEDRVRHHRRSNARTCRSRTCATTSSATSDTMPREGRSISRSTSTRTLPPTIHTDAKRLLQMLKNLLVERVQVHRARRRRRCASASPSGGWTPDTRC